MIGAEFDADSVVPHAPRRVFLPRPSLFPFAFQYLARDRGMRAAMQSAQLSQGQRHDAVVALDGFSVANMARKMIYCIRLQAILALKNALRHHPGYPKRAQQIHLEFQPSEQAAGCSSAHLPRGSYVCH